MDEIMSTLLDTEALGIYTHLDGPAYLLTILIVFAVAKLLYDLFTPFKLSRQLPVFGDYIADACRAV